MSKSHIEDDAASVADRAASAVGIFADDAKSQVDGLVSKATGAAEQAYGHARGHLRGATAAVTTSVERQPLVAMVVAGFVCTMVGYLLARR
jgi:ElaB/YqjD/DUF883 family membrane-anchored ribosome-binding protein